MATSQNGWPVATREQQDRAPLIRDVVVPNGVLAGNVAVVFRWLAGQYDRRVERLKPGTCWGWFVKPIEGSRAVSNHASGTAVDFNAPDNPMGVPTRQFMTAKQITECRAIVRESGGVLRWGGDYTGRPDAMHWEIVGNRLQVATLANKIKQNQLEDDDVALTEAQTRALFREELAAAIPKIWGYDIDPGPASHTAYGALWTVLGRTGALNLVPAMSGAIAELVDGHLDPEAFATLVASKLPADRDDVTPAELQQALVAAARELLAQA